MEDLNCAHSSGGIRIYYSAEARQQEANMMAESFSLELPSRSERAIRQCMTILASELVLSDMLPPTIHYHSNLPKQCLHPEIKCPHAQDNGVGDISHSNHCTQFPLYHQYLAQRCSQPVLSSVAGLQTAGLARV